MDRYRAGATVASRQHDDPKLLAGYAERPFRCRLSIGMRPFGKRATTGRRMSSQKRGTEAFIMKAISKIIATTTRPPTNPVVNLRAGRSQPKIEG